MKRFLMRIARMVLFGQGKIFAKMLIAEQVSKLSGATIQALERGLSATYYTALRTATPKDDKIVRGIIDFLGLRVLPLDEE